MKLKISQKDQIILMLTGVLILMLLFAFFVVMPKINQIKDLRTQQELENNELESAKATLSRLKSLKKDSAKIEAEIAKLKAKMPENPELPSLILQINKIASDAGIDFITISPGELPEMGDSEYISVPLSITTTGRFFNLIDFLYRVRNNEREIKVTSVGISQGPDGLPDLTVSIKADAFVVR